MTEHELTPDDTAAMRKDGSWREYLRSEQGRGKYRAEQAGKKPAVAPTPGRKPGGWPPGTRPPDPPPAIPDAEVARAVQEYRAWQAAGCPPIDTHCECPACRTLEGGTR